MSIGSATGGGIDNIWYTNVFCSGPTKNGAGATLSTTRDTCIKVKSPDDGTNAATVSKVNYEGLYIQYEGNGIWVYPYYSCPGTAPTYSDFLFQDVTLGTTPGSMSFQSWSASHQSTMAFNNFTATGSFNGPNTPSCSPGWSGDAYGDFTVGPNPVNSTLQAQLAAGTGSVVSAPLVPADVLLLTLLIPSLWLENWSCRLHRPPTSSAPHPRLVLPPDLRTRSLCRPLCRRVLSTTQWSPRNCPHPDARPAPLHSGIVSPEPPQFR